MTKRLGPQPHKVSITEEIPNAAKYVKDAARSFAYLTNWIDPGRLIEQLGEQGLHVLQINQDLKWLSKKFKEAQSYGCTPEIAEFEKEVIMRVGELNRYAARFENALDFFKSLTHDLEELEIEDSALAIRLAKEKWKVLEKTMLTNAVESTVRSTGSK